MVVGSDGTGPGASAATVDQVWMCQGEHDDERLGGQIELVYNIAGWIDIWCHPVGLGSHQQRRWHMGRDLVVRTVEEGGEQVVLGWYQSTRRLRGLVDTRETQERATISRRARPSASSTRDRCRRP